MKTANFLVTGLLVALTSLQAGDSMSGMTGPNYLRDGRFEKTEEVVYPWTGVDEFGFLRKSVQMRGVNIHVDKSNQFSYGYLANSASFVDLDGDKLPDIVAPDGAGIFWFWKNIGAPGNPKFGLGEVMPLLVDNERSRFAPIDQAPENKGLSKTQEREKGTIDAKREKAAERILREMKRNPKGQQLTPEQIAAHVKTEFPYPWESAGASPPGSTLCTLNGFRQLRAVAAPCDLQGDGLIDFLVGDAQGTLYLAKNSGRPGQPNYRTYTKSQDGVILKLVPSYNIVTRQTTLTPANFMNYTTPFVCDWDRNGVPDVLLGEGTYSVNTVRLFLNFTRANLATENGRNEFGLMVGEERTFLSPFAWDWDGDGWLDLFVNDADGRLTVFPNPGGKYASGGAEMTECQNVTFQGQESAKFLRFSCPQPCDWNEDGIMDLIWSEQFGRIFFALGKQKGGLDFGSPTPVKTSTPDRVKYLSLPQMASFCAVPASRHQGHTGGTGDAQRFLSQAGNTEDANGWPSRMSVFYGLMPSWNPDVFFAKDKKGRTLYQIPKMSASWGVAPVPYEVFHVIEEAADGNGVGNTFTQTWHDPAENSVFRQRRDAPTKFGQGVTIAFMGLENEDTVDANVRLSFFMKLEGKFDRLTAVGHAGYRNGGDRPEGGKCIFKTITPPPIGRWFHYESVVPKGKHPRDLGEVDLWLTGRGNVSIRDVAFSTTNAAPDSP